MSSENRIAKFQAEEEVPRQNFLQSCSHALRFICTRTPRSLCGASTCLSATSSTATFPSAWIKVAHQLEFSAPTNDSQKIFAITITKLLHEKDLPAHLNLDDHLESSYQHIRPTCLTNPSGTQDPEPTAREPAPGTF